MAKWKENLLCKRFFFYQKRLMTLTFDLDIGSRSLHTLYPRIHHRESLSPIGSRGKKGILNLFLSSRNFFKVTAHPLSMGTLWLKFEPNFLTFSFHPENFYKVTTHPLPKGTLWLKFDPNLMQWIKNMPRTMKLGWRTNTELGSKKCGKPSGTDWYIRVVYKNWSKRKK